MNTGRLYVIALALRDDFNKLKIRAALKSLVESLQNQISHPNKPNHQQSVDTQLHKLIDSLSKSITNNFTPAWLQVVDDIGGSEFIGKTLSLDIQEVFERSNITPSVAHEEISQIHAKLSKFAEALTSLINAFNILNIEPENLNPGECELGITVPRSAVENTLSNFGKELVELNKIFSVFSELVTGSRKNYEIRTIASSSLTVFLDCIPEIAACAAVSIERVVALYKQLLDIRKHKIELKKQGVPEESMKGVDSHADTLMENGIADLINELIGNYHDSKDKGRENELRIEAKYALNKLAKRIDIGYKVDIRIAPDTGDDNTGNELPDRITNTIMNASKNIQYLQVEGEPILTLPESQDDEKASNKRTT